MGCPSAPSSPDLTVQLQMSSAVLSSPSGPKDQISGRSVVPRPADRRTDIRGSTDRCRSYPCSHRGHPSRRPTFFSVAGSGQTLAVLVRWSGNPWCPGQYVPTPREAIRSELAPLAGPLSCGAQKSGHDQRDQITEDGQHDQQFRQGETGTSSSTAWKNLHCVSSFFTTPLSSSCRIPAAAVPPAQTRSYSHHQQHRRLGQPDQDVDLPGGLRSMPSAMLTRTWSKLFASSATRIMAMTGFGISPHAPAAATASRRRRCFRPRREWPRQDAVAGRVAADLQRPQQRHAVAQQGAQHAAEPRDRVAVKHGPATGIFSFQRSTNRRPRSPCATRRSQYAQPASAAASSTP